MLVFKCDCDAQAVQFIRQYKLTRETRFSVAVVRAVKQVVLIF